MEFKLVDMQPLIANVLSEVISLQYYNVVLYTTIYMSGVALVDMC